MAVVISFHLREVWLYGMPPVFHWGSRASGLRGWLVHHPSWSHLGGWKDPRWYSDRTCASRATALTSCHTVQSWFKLCGCNCVACSHSAVPYSLWLPLPHLNRQSCQHQYILAIKHTILVKHPQDVNEQHTHFISVSKQCCVSYFRS